MPNSGEAGSKLAPVATVQRNEGVPSIVTVHSTRSLDATSHAGVRLVVSFQKVFYSPGTRHERSRETHVAQVNFTLRDRVPNPRRGSDDVGARP